MSSDLLFPVGSRVRINHPKFIDPNWVKWQNSYPDVRPLPYENLHLATGTVIDTHPSPPGRETRRIELDDPSLWPGNGDPPVSPYIDLASLEEA